MSNPYENHNPYGSPEQQPSVNPSSPYQEGPFGSGNGPVFQNPFIDPYQPQDHPSNRHQPAFVKGQHSPAAGSPVAFPGSNSLGTTVFPDSPNANKVAGSIFAVCALLVLAHGGVVGLGVAAIAYAMSRSSFVKSGAALAFNTVMAYSAAAIVCWALLGVVGHVMNNEIQDTVMMVLRYGFGIGLAGLGVAAFMGNLLNHPVQIRSLKN